jgi:hypothetical protein
MNEIIDSAVQSVVIKSSLASNHLAQYGRFLTAALGAAVATIGIAYLKQREQGKLDFFR